MKVDTPILVKNVTGTGINIQLKGKCLDTVIENQQSKRHKEVQLLRNRILSREHEKYQNRMSAFHHMCEMGGVRQEWTENLVEFYLEWRKRKKRENREGYREVGGQREIVMR